MQLGGCLILGVAGENPSRPFPYEGFVLQCRSMNFSEKLESVVKDKKSCLLLGLDPNLEKLPAGLPKTPEGVFVFCKSMIDSCEKFICGIKPQMAYFEVLGAKGILVLEQLLAYAKEKELLTIIDGKRNDIGSTAEAYASAYLGDGPLGGDALTVNAYLGDDGILPFVQKCEENGRGIFVLVRTSNPSAAEIQDKTEVSVAIAEKVEEWNVSTQSPKNMFASVGAVIGATQPEALKFFREEMPHAWFLCPGVGVQGGNMEDVLAVRKKGIGVLVPISRAVLYASEEKDFAEKGAEVMQEFWETQKEA